MSLSRNLKTITGSVIGIGLAAVFLPLMFMASGIIEFWAGIKGTFTKNERLNVNSGDEQ